MQYGSSFHDSDTNKLSESKDGVNISQKTFFLNLTKSCLLKR